MRIAIYANDYETVIQISELLDYFMKRMMVEADIDCLSIEKKEEILINSSQEKYDLIYLDLQITNSILLEVKKNISEQEQIPFVIYISPEPRYLEEVIGNNKIAYINKPLKKRTFESSFREAVKIVSEKDLFFEFKNRRKLEKIRLEDVKYFESDGRRIIIHFKDDKINVFYSRLDDVEKIIKKELNCECFLRKHKSFLINYNYIYKNQRTSIILLDGESIPISRSYQKN